MNIVNNGNRRRQGQTMIKSPCGVFECNSCEHLSAERCPGCTDGNAYLEKRGMETCAVFQCIERLGIRSCTECGMPSCELSRLTEDVCPLRGRFENKRWWAGKLAHGVGAQKIAVRDAAGERISDRTIDRIRWYLAALDSYVEQGVNSVSSWQLAQKVGVKAPLIRKDLSRFGEFGTPSLGYDVKYLRKKILDILKLDESRHVVWIGARRLRDHLAEMQRACRNNCHMIAVLDPDPEEVGKKIADITVQPMENLPSVLASVPIDVAVLAIPLDDAPGIANVISRAGVTAILNLSASLLSVPEHITVRNVDIGGELLALSYYCVKNREDAESAKRKKTSKN